MYKLTHKYGKTHNISLSLSLYMYRYMHETIN